MSDGAAEKHRKSKETVLEFLCHKLGDAEGKRRFDYLVRLIDLGSDLSKDATAKLRVHAYEINEILSGGDALGYILTKSITEMHKDDFNELIPLSAKKQLAECVRRCHKKWFVK